MANILLGAGSCTSSKSSKSGKVSKALENTNINKPAPQAVRRPFPMQLHHCW